MLIRSFLFALMLTVTVEASGTSLAAWIEMHGGSWSPDTAMLAIAEKALKPAVASAAKGRDRAPPWSQYHFQYQGRTTLLGHKYVYINAFCGDTDGDASKEWVTVLDGGACYFSAKFDPELRRVYDVVVNGVA
jgi:hypothetical protein